MSEAQCADAVLMIRPGALRREPGNRCFEPLPAIPRVGGRRGDGTA